MKLKALRDEVLVKRIIKQETSGGIILPGRKNECMKGQVVAVGTRLERYGKPKDFSVKSGDVVFFPKGTGQIMDTGDEKFLMLKHEDILGVLMD